MDGHGAHTHIHTYGHTASVDLAVGRRQGGHNSHGGSHEKKTVNLDGEEKAKAKECEREREKLIKSRLLNAEGSRASSLAGYDGTVRFNLNLFFPPTLSSLRVSHPFLSPPLTPRWPLHSPSFYHCNSFRELSCCLPHPAPWLLLLLLLYSCSFLFSYSLSESTYYRVMERSEKFDLLFRDKSSRKSRGA